MVPGFQKGLVGHGQVGCSSPCLDLTATMLGGNPQIDVKIGDTLIFVVDVVAVPLSGPEGSKVAPDRLARRRGQGRHSGGEHPEVGSGDTLQVQPLIKGKGKKVAAGDTVTFDYVWQRWSDGKILEETYNSKPAEAPLSELLPGMVKGLTDQTVGSRVLLVIPPSEGYPEGNATPRSTRVRPCDGGRPLVHSVRLTPLSLSGPRSRSDAAWRPAAAEARK